jgi:hypothetical protein
VNDEEELVLEAEHDPLAHPTEGEHPTVAQRGDRWVHGTEHERTEEPHATQATAEDSWLQGFEVDDDVGELGQAQARV